MEIPSARLWNGQHGEPSPRVTIFFFFLGNLTRQLPFGDSPLL